MGWVEGAETPAFSYWVICFSSGWGCGNWKGAGQGADGGGEEVVDEGGRLAAIKPFFTTHFLFVPSPMQLQGRV